MKNQCEMLLDYMLAHGSVTGMESIVELGIMNYKGRISDLRRLGYDIRTVYETGENRHGEPTRYARYYLRGTP
jgi:hypothetical protein